jgi:UDP-glucose 4-epimerase
MNILIVGSEGFIGSHLIDFYLKKGWTVSGADLVDYPKQNYKFFKVSRFSPGFDELFQDNPIDICINAAGNGSVPFSVEHPVSDFEANVLDTIKLLDSIRKYAPQCKYLHISSAAVYGNPKSLPIKENDSCFPVSPYGWHKLASENICTQYHVIFGIATLIVRPFSVYGPGLRKQLIWDLYHKLKRSGSVELFGTGNETRDFIFIDDLVNTLDLLINKADFTAKKYNIASGEETAIREVAALFSKNFKDTKSINFNQQIRKGDPLNWRADISTLKNLGFNSGISLGAGLESTFNWLEENG